MISKSGSIDDWKELRNTTDILGEESNLTANKIQEFDYELNIILPVSYINFLEVFGQGFLGESVRIHWPSRNLSKTLIGFHKEILTYRGNGNSYFTEEEAQPNLELLENSFAFGDTDTEELIVWDLRTYNLQDDSYDIYWIPFESHKSYKIGRSFYDFVTKFCFGDQMLEKLPQEEQLHIPSMTRTFTGYGNLHLL